MDWTHELVEISIELNYELLGILSYLYIYIPLYKRKNSYNNMGSDPKQVDLQPTNPRS